MKKNQYEKWELWLQLLEALLNNVATFSTKVDKKGREFVSFSFHRNRWNTGFKSLVVYTTQKGDLRILTNRGISTNRGLRNKSLCFLLKNINEQEFFLLCGKERLGNHNKRFVLDALTGKNTCNKEIGEDNEPF